MSPTTASPNPSFDEDPRAVAEERAALEALARDKPIVVEPSAAGDEDEDEEDEDDDYKDDDDVPTDEEGYERTPMKDPVPDVAPAIRADRVPATDAEPEGSIDKVEAASLGIQEIENLEDDAKGG